MLTRARLQMTYATVTNRLQMYLPENRNMIIKVIIALSNHRGPCRRPCLSRLRQFFVERGRFGRGVDPQGGRQHIAAAAVGIDCLGAAPQ